MQNYRKTVLIMLAVFMSVAFYGCASARESEKSDESRNYKIIDTSSDSLLRFETGTIEDGKNVNAYNSVRTIDYLPVENIDSVGIAEGYTVRLFQYRLDDGTYTLLGSGIYDSSFLMEDVIETDSEYMRFAVLASKKGDEADETNSELLTRSGLCVTPKDGRVYINCVRGMMMESVGKIAVMYSPSFYTPEYIRLKKGTVIAVHNNFQLEWYAYRYASDSKQYRFLGSSPKKITNGVFYPDDVLGQYPDATHIRLELTDGDNSTRMTYGDITVSEVSVLRDRTKYSAYQTGSISSDDGSDNTSRNDRFYTPDYMKLDDFRAVTVNRGYNLIWFAYGESLLKKNYLQTSGWLEAGNYFTAEDIRRQCPDAKYVRFAVGAENKFTIAAKKDLSDAIKNSGVSIYGAQNVPAFHMGNIISESEASDKNTPGKVVASPKKIAASLCDASYIDVDKIKTVSLNEDASVSICFYDKQYHYLGKTNDYAASAQIKLDYFSDDYPEMKYARFELKGAYGDLDLSKTQPSEKMISVSRDEIPYSTFRCRLDYSNSAGKTGFIKAGKIKSLQDGAVYKNALFVMGSPNMGHMYDVNTFAKKADVVLDDTVSIHSNSVCFGTQKYSEEDEFPLLYCNVYNNYASMEDRKEGTCGVFRLVRDKHGNYKGELVQLLRIGFVENLSLWESTGGGKDFRPYGNFIVDTDKNRLYAFVIRDKEKIVRFFEFNCPQVNVADAYETVILNEEDILSSFDLNYYYALQGAAYHNGMIYSSEGFSNSAIMHIVDLKHKRLFATVDLAAMGFAHEPEAVFVSGDDILFSNATGNVYKMIIG